MKQGLFQIGEKLRAVNTLPLPGNDIAPPLELEMDYTIKGVCFDKAGNQHLDVGLVSDYGVVKSYETKENLPNSGKGEIHWCHPSRFVKVQPKTNS